MDEVTVTVCYARPDFQFIEELRLPAGTVLRDALERCGLRRQLPDFDPQQAVTGIYGKVKDGDTPLRDGDRIEIYRPLLADPKESRRRRVIKKEAGRR